LRLKTAFFSPIHDSHPAVNVSRLQYAPPDPSIHDAVAALEQPFPSIAFSAAPFSRRRRPAPGPAPVIVALPSIEHGKRL